MYFCKMNLAILQYVQYLCSVKVIKNNVQLL